MNDRDIMENLLLTTKGVCDLYLHGTIESCSAPVHQAFCGALNDSLNMQESIYQDMSGHGWYTTENAEPQKINQVRQKFA